MPTAGNLLQWIVVCLLSLAVVMVYSAGLTVDTDPMDYRLLVMGRPAVYALLALLAMIITGHLDIRRLYARPGLANPVFWLLALSVGLCVMALIPGFGRNVNGASRWVYLGPRSLGFSFQPSEMAKWAMVLAMAWWGARQADRMHRFGSGLMPGLLILGGVCALVVIEDLGTAVLIGAVGVLVLIAAGARLWQVVLLMPVMGAAVVAMIVTSPYRMRRISSFMDPFADPQGSGYHLIQSLAGIAGGTLTGRGLGNGVVKFGHLPEDTTDFLFAVICSELGVAGAALVVGLYVAMIWVGVGILNECRHAFGRLLGFGILMTVGLQAAMNIAVVTGVVPTKGIALPLLSSGGTGWVMTAGAIGLLVAIDRLNRLETMESAEPQDRVDASWGGARPVSA